MTRSIFRRVLLIVVILLVAIGAIAPLISANHFKSQIQSALESSLNRRVSIGDVHLNVFTGLGFTLDDVLIEEAPGMGIEPFAHVDSLKARIRLASLWTGHLGFSHLTLAEPSVNFVKSDAGPWNIQPFLNRARLVDAGASAPVPEIQISDGRLNFKFGNTKSVFYISGADLDIYPNQSGGVVIRFSGEPSRTDHTAQGLGRLVARGVLKSKPNTDDQLSMSVQLERTAIDELTRLFDAHDIGIRGVVASNLKLDGPLSKLNLSGDLRIEGIHRWDLMPGKSDVWTLNYAGSLSLPAQQLDIETRAGDQQGSPVNAKFVASNYLTEPKWQASLSLHDLPAASLLNTARHMGAALPDGATLDGKLNGELEYSRPAGMSGELVLTNASFKFPQGGVTEFASAPVAIRNNDVRFGPAEMILEQDQSAQLEARYALDTRALTLGLETKQLSIAQTKGLIARLLGTGSVPFLEKWREGNWKGALAFARNDDAPGDWTGDFELQNAQIDVPGFSVPLHLATATVQMQKDQIVLSRMHGRAGTIGFDGEYRYSAKSDRLDRLRLSIDKLELAEAERVLLPTLARQQGFLERALRLQRRPVPEWLKARAIDGSLQVRSLRSGENELGSVRGRIAWNGTRVDFPGLESKEGSGKLAIDLSGPVPRYTLAGQLRGIDYRGGTLDLEGVLETQGLGNALALNAKSDGTFDGNGLTLAADTEVDEISGDYHLEAGAHLIVSKVQVTQGPEVLHGQGASQADGRLVLELTTTARKPVRMTGMLLPLHP